ncbi:MAG: DNA polymerase III subunit delta', partial [Clostridia bacterium]|nr:DNA polymerase III subunit delta' [Clostridia bacterium]
MISKLQTLVDAGRVPHALVIDGGTFESRLYCAKELAAALLKEDKKVMADIHPDVITVLPEEKKKTLSVDVIRKMREDAYIIPNENERKVYIIGRAELMLDYAQNALLKILEEPPKYAT